VISRCVVLVSQNCYTLIHVCRLQLSLCHAPRHALPSAAPRHAPRLHRHGNRTASSPSRACPAEHPTAKTLRWSLLPTLPPGAHTRAPSRVCHWCATEELNPPLATTVHRHHLRLPTPSLNPPKLHLAEHSWLARWNRCWGGLRSVAPPFSIAGASSDLRTASNGTLGEHTPFPHPFLSKPGPPLAVFRRFPLLAAARDYIARSEIFLGARTQNLGTCL
jgi:hypothetical protein